VLVWGADISLVSDGAGHVFNPGCLLIFWSVPNCCLDLLEYRCQGWYPLHMNYYWSVVCFVLGYVTFGTLVPIGTSEARAMHRSPLLCSILNCLVQLLSNVVVYW
jgi:hypothetical protein